MFAQQVRPQAAGDPQAAGSRGRLGSAIKSSSSCPSLRARGGAKGTAEKYMSFSLHDLEQRLRERAAAGADVSYTRKLLDRGVAQCAKKLGEEAVETVIAALCEDRNRLIAESADLIYHLLVVLKARDITLAEIEAALDARTGKSGLEEKTSRLS